MVKKILTRKPKEYLQQGWNHCGAYSVKALLEAYGKDNEKNLHNYHLNWFGKITGCTAGRSDYWPAVLRKRDLSVISGNANQLSETEKIELLKSFLTQNAPVMISIGNGYVSNGKFYPVLQKLFTHWITLWGYDDEKQEFYVYDSGLAPQAYNPAVPIGNTSRSFAKVVRDWGVGIFPWPKGSSYIAVTT